MIVEKGYGLITPEHLVRRRVAFKALGDLTLALGLVVEDFAQKYIRTPCLLRIAFLLRPDRPPIGDAEQFGLVGGLERELQQLRDSLEKVPVPRVVEGPVGVFFFFAVHGRPAHEPDFCELFSFLEGERREALTDCWPLVTGVQLPAVEQAQYGFWKDLPGEKPGWRNGWGWWRKKTPAREYVARFDPENPLFPQLAAQIDLPQFGQWLADQPDPEQVPLGVRAQYLQRTGDGEGASRLFDRMVTDLPGDERAWLERGRHRLVTGELEPALRDFDKALVINPDFASARLQRAIVLQELDASDEALRELGRCLELRPGFLEARALRVRILMHSGKLREAREELAIWREWNPNDYEATGRWIYTMRCTERLDQAQLEKLLAEAERGLRLEPGNRGLGLERIYLLAAMGNWADVIRRLDETLVHDPAFHEVRRMKACGLLESGQPADARHEYGLAIADAPPGTHGMYWTERARSQLMLGDFDAAIADTEQALAISDADSLALFLQGEVHLARQDGAAALRCFTTLAERTPGEAVIHEKRGIALTLLGRFGQATGEFDQALAIEPGRGPALYYLAIALRQSGKHAEALERLEEAARAADENPPLLWERAQLLADLNRPAESIAALDRLLQLTPDFPEALRLRAGLHEQGRDFQRAETDLNRLAGLFPDATEPYWRRARMWTLAGNDELAEQEVERIIERQPEQAGVFRSFREIARAEKLHREEDHDGAIAVLDAILAEEPGHPVALQLRGVCRWYDGLFVEAEEDFTALIHTAESGSEPQRDLLLRNLSARGQVLAELGEYERAIEDLTRVIEGGGGTEGPLLAAYSRGCRGFCLASLGRFADAREDFAEAEKLCPANGWLHFNRGRSRLLENRTDEAISCFRQALAARLPPLNRRQRLQAEGLLARHQ